MKEKFLFVTVVVRGPKPAPQGSKNAIPLKKNGQFTGKVNQVESSKLVKPYRQQIIIATREQMYDINPDELPYAGPVVVRVTFTFKRPQRPKYDYPRQGDTDKLQRAVGDALEASGLIANDTQIVRWDALKQYGQPGEMPCTVIEIYPASV